jgi:hypothetical protein
MAAKNLEELIVRLRHWPKENPSGYQLTDAQAEEVARIQLEISEGRATFAADEQMVALWKSCGL